MLPTLCWPAFAIHENPIKYRAVDKVIRRLKGKYGIKRFLRDGYKTPAEDQTRKYYYPAEVKVTCAWQSSVGPSCFFYSFFLFIFLFFRAASTAEGRLGVSDVTLVSGILGLSFDTPFLSPLFWLILLLFLCGHFFIVCVVRSFFLFPGLIKLYASSTRAKSLCLIFYYWFFYIPTYMFCFRFVYW